MSNKERIESELSNHGATIGVYDKDLDRLSAKQIETVLETAVQDSGDVKLCMNGEVIVVEVMYVDDEADFFVLTKDEYDERYN